MTLFGRVAKLTLGVVEIDAGDSAGLRVAFQVKRSTNLESNSAKLQVFNLSKDTRSRIDDAAAQSSQPGVIGNVSLEAGLGEDGARSIFCGDRAWVSHRRIGVDVITSVEMVDGGKGLSQILNISEAPNISARALVESIRREMSLAWNQAKTGGDIVAALDNVLFGAGKTFHSTGQKALRELADAAGLSVSVQDCEIVFEKPGTLPPDSGVVLSQRSGLIGAPERYRDPENPSASLVRGEALLNGKLRPGRRFVLDAEEEFGTFKVLEVQHVGDTHGGDGAWRSEWEAQEV